MAIIDFYDDLTGDILKNKLGADQVPSFIKTAAYLTEDERDTLPDDVFALVAVDRTSKMRKYACVDKGNTALSVIYFMANRDKLPLEMQKVAAENLVRACEWYGLEQPAQLKKIALAPLAAVGAVGTIAHALSGAVDLGKKLLTKGADLVGTEVMPTSAPVKEKHAHLQPYVSAEGQQVPIKVASPVRYEDDFYCLVKEGSAHFPIKTTGEVEQAVTFFAQSGYQLHPEDRRAYCIKLAARADEVGVPLPDGIRKYAGQEYAPENELEIAVQSRLQFFTEDGPERDLLKGLFEKRSSVSPEIFAESLRLFDETTGLHYRWDETLDDPYYSTFGFTKEATWSFIAGNDRVTEDQLDKLIQADYKLLKCRFGEEIAEELKKRPREIFDSLPLDSKRIIMRMANEVGRTKQAI